MEYIMEQMTALVSVFAITLVGLVAKAAGDAITAYIVSLRKQHMDSRATDVVLESLEIAAVRLFPDIALALRDGKIDSKELAALKATASTIAETRLKSLAGFAKANLGDWVRLKVDSGTAYVMRKLRMEVIGPNDKAVE